MLNGVLAPLLCLSSRCEPDSGFAKRLFPIGWNFSLKIEQVSRRINIRVAGSTGELILYFKWFLKTWVGKLSRNSVARVYFTCLRRRTKPRRAQLKLFSSGGTFRLSWVSQPIVSVLLNESWKFEYYRTPRHKCKTPSSGTAFLFCDCVPFLFLPPPRECPWKGLGWYGLIVDVVS